MRTQSWLLPEGVDELLAPESWRLESLRRVVVDLFAAWGYELVIPPFMDYVDSLLTGTGGDLDLRTFKVIDQLSGKTMGLRADMTPQVARIDARRLRAEGPTRLCYVGTVLHTSEEVAGEGRIPMQVGAELYGHRGVASDCEVCCLMLQTLAAARIARVHLDLGHVGIFRAVARHCALSEPAEQVLHDALQRKAADDIERAAREYGLREQQVEMLVALANLHGGAEVLDRAKSVLEPAGPDALRCLEELAELAAAVGMRNPQIPVHYDLAELRGYNYHTGVLFSALVPGVGKEIARGGRYDEIGNVFGRARPATGFSTDLKQLMTLGSLESAGPADETVVAPWSDDPALLEEIARLRNAGRTVVQLLPGETPFAAAGSSAGVCRRLEPVSGGGWKVAEPEDSSQ